MQLFIINNTYGSACWSISIRATNVALWDIKFCHNTPCRIHNGSFLQRVQLYISLRGTILKSLYTFYWLQYFVLKQDKNKKNRFYLLYVSKDMITNNHVEIFKFLFPTYLGNKWLMNTLKICRTVICEYFYRTQTSFSDRKHII